MKFLSNWLFASLFAVFLMGCQQNTPSGGTALPPDLTGFESTPIGNGKAMKVVKKNPAGKVLEEGIIVDGARNGSWITYHPAKEKVVKSIANYVDNELNGLFLTFSLTGQVETLTSYLNGQYDGNFAKFRFGNIKESATYVGGQLDGVYKKFYDNRKLQMEAYYKDGKQHGPYRYYDEEGNLVMEYEYQNGEKVSGSLKTQE